MRYLSPVTADPTLRKKYRKLQRWNLLFRQIYGPPGPAFWGVDQWSDRLGGYFTRHGNRNFAIRQVSRMLRVVHRQLRQEGRSIWLLPIDHQSHQRPSFLYGNLRQRFPRRSAEAERRWIMRLRQRLLAARQGAEDQESQLGSGSRLLVNEAHSFWQQRGFRRRVPLELAHHNIVAARWEDPDRLLLNPHFLRLMRPAVAFLREAEGFPPAFRAMLFQRRRRLGQRFAQLALSGHPNPWTVRRYYWNRGQRQTQLRQQLRLRLRFRQVLGQLRVLLKRVAAAAAQGSLKPLQGALGLETFQAPAGTFGGVSPLGTRLAREPRFRRLWTQLRRHCGPSLPAKGTLWLVRQLGSTLEKNRNPQALSRFRVRARTRTGVLREEGWLGRVRDRLRLALGQFRHHRRHTLRCTVPGRWLRRRLRALRRYQSYRRFRRLRHPRRALRRLSQRLKRPFGGFSPEALSGTPHRRRRRAALQRVGRRQRRRLRRRVLRRRRLRRPPSRWGGRKPARRRPNPGNRPPVGRRGAVSPPVGRRGAVSPPVGRRGAVSPPVGRRRVRRRRQTCRRPTRVSPPVSSGGVTAGKPFPVVAGPSVPGTVWETQSPSKASASSPRKPAPPVRRRPFGKGSRRPKASRPWWGRKRIILGRTLSRRQRLQIRRAKPPTALTRLSHRGVLRNRQKQLRRYQSRLQRTLRVLRRKEETLRGHLTPLEQRWEPLRHRWEESLTRRDVLTQLLGQRRRRLRQLQRQMVRQHRCRRGAQRRLKALLRNCENWRSRQRVLLSEKALSPPDRGGQLATLGPLLAHARRQQGQMQKLGRPVPRWLPERWSALRHQWLFLVHVFRSNQREKQTHRREKIRLVTQIRRSGREYRRFLGRTAALGRSRHRLVRSCGRLGRSRAQLQRRWAPLQRRWETLWVTLNRHRRQQDRLRLRRRDLVLRLAPATLYGQLLRRRQALLRAEGRVAHSRRRSLALFRRRLRRDFGRRFSPNYRLPRRLRQRRLLLRRRRRPQLRRWEPRKRGGQTPRRPRRGASRRARRQLPRHMRRQQQRQRRLRPHRKGRRLVTGTSKRPKLSFTAPKEQKISTQSWKTVQRPLPRTLSFRYTKPGQVQATGRWRFPATPALVVRRGRLKRLPFRRVPAAVLPQRGEALRAKLLHPGADRQRHSSRLPLVHYRILELTIGDPTALDEDGNELPPERWLVLERSYGPVGYDTLMADLFGVLTPALRLMAKVVGHKSARRTVYHARDGVPLAQRRKLIFGWLRDLVNKNPDYNYLRRNTLRKRPSKRVLLRPERSRRLTEPFQSRLYAELHQLLQPEEPIMERLEDFDEKSHQLRLTRRHYRWN